MPSTDISPTFFYLFKILAAKNPYVGFYLKCVKQHNLRFHLTQYQHMLFNEIKRYHYKFESLRIPSNF